MGAPRFVMDDFWPSDLFLGGIPGAWYDPTDLSTMFQDSAGTTPVTAVEQPVGLILDKSQGLALGADVVTNGDFSSGASWALEPGWAIGAGLATKTAGVAAAIYQPAPAMVQGRTYLVTFTVSGYTAGILYPVCRGTLGTGVTANGTYTQALIAGATAARAVEFFANATFAGSLDNVTVRELAGNHASQSTAASRPTYRARYNLLTYSEDFGNAAWTATRASVAISTAVSPPSGVTTFYKLTEDSTASNTHLLLTSADTVVTNGARYTSSIYARAAERTWIALQEGQGVTATAYFNLATGALGTISGTGSPTAAIESVGGGWYRCTISWTASGTAARVRVFLATGDGGAIYTGNGTSGVYVSGAQILTAADVTATGNAYQRIAAATVYDTAPIFRPYLAFDGLDDSLSTAAINFTSTDKMSVFSGVTKSSDAGTGMVAELSVDAGANNGAFYVAAPNQLGDNFGFVSRGTINRQTVPTGFAAPTTSVLTALTDIAAPSLALRRNGTQIGSSVLSQGTGTFGNYAMFIGRRNNSIYPLNGRLYSLIVRGAASSVTEIADTELWVNARTGAF